MGRKIGQTHTTKYTYISSLQANIAIRMPPLWGFLLLEYTVLHRCRRYATEEGFDVFKVFAEDPVRLECRSHLGEYAAKPNLPGRGMRIQEVFDGFKGSEQDPVRLETRTYRAGGEGGYFFLKLTLMVRFPNRTIVNLAIFMVFWNTDINMPPLRGLGLCLKTLL